MTKKINREEREKVLEKVESVLNYSFQKRTILEEALTHSSYANEHRNNQVKDNERLEFLGDAILDLVISEYLFKKHPEMPEGDLSKVRASIVCENSLAKISRMMHVGEYLLLGKGEELTGGRERSSILADAFEALTGGIFLDGGFDKAKSFLERTLVHEVESIASLEGLYTDYKTLLQEVIQKSSHLPLHYEVVAEEGPDHDKYFYVEVCHNQKILGRGMGKSKKEAEQDAARIALNKLKD